MSKLFNGPAPGYFKSSYYPSEPDYTDAQDVEAEWAWQCMSEPDYIHNALADGIRNPSAILCGLIALAAAKDFEDIGSYKKLVELLLDGLYPHVLNQYRESRE